jgi:hypothetical protein
MVIMNDLFSEERTVVIDNPYSGIHYQGSDMFYHHFKGIYALDALPSSALFGVPTEITSTKFDSDVDLAVSALHKEINDAPMKVLVTLAEAGKTFKSMNRLLRAARDLLKKAKAGTLLRARKKISVAQLADIYLEVRYGLRPIVYDVLAAIEAIETLGTNKRTNVSIHRSLSSEELEFQVGGVAYSSTGGASDSPLTSVYDCNERRTCYLRAGAVVEFDTKLHSTVDVLGSDEILESLLELTRFSFIANWFFNIADFLASWTPDIGVTVKGTYVSLTEEVTRTLIVDTAQIAYPYVPVTTNLTGGTCKTRVVRHRRYSNPSKPKFPRLRINMDGLKVLDLVGIFGDLTADFSRWKI